MADPCGSPPPPYESVPSSPNHGAETASSLRSHPTPPHSLPPVLLRRPPPASPPPPFTASSDDQNAAPIYHIPLDEAPPPSYSSSLATASAALASSSPAAASIPTTASSSPAAGAAAASSAFAPPSYDSLFGVLPSVETISVLPTLPKTTQSPRNTRTITTDGATADPSGTGTRSNGDGANGATGEADDDARQSAEDRRNSRRQSMILRVAALRPNPSRRSLRQQQRQQRRSNRRANAPSTIVTTTASATTTTASPSSSPTASTKNPHSCMLLALLTLVINPLVGWLAVMEARASDVAFARGDLNAAADFQSRVKAKLFFSLFLSIFIASVILGVR